MQLDRFLKALGPVVAMAMASGSRKEGLGSASSGGGVPLSDLDLTGELPAEVDLMGPDDLRIKCGDPFSIHVEGGDDAQERMRFKLANGRLSVMRSKGNWGGGDSARVTVVMPPPARLVMAGSGKIACDGLAQEAEVTIAGSGDIDASDIDIGALELRIAGSGRFRASGRVRALDCSIAGSGDAKMKRLKVEQAALSIAGSGDASFRCDGTVEARIVGSGNITVRGSARCSVKSLGSGQLTCKRDKTPA